MIKWLFRPDPQPDCVCVTNFIFSDISDFDNLDIFQIPTELRLDLNQITSNWVIDIQFVEGRRRTESESLPALAIVFDSAEDNVMFRLKYGNKYQFTNNQKWIYIS